MSTRQRKLILNFVWIIFTVVGFIPSCTRYPVYIGDLVPVVESEQPSQMHLSDDGTVTFVHERLEISLRPMTDEELNRRFPDESQGGAESVNPYTYGDWKDPRTGQTPRRFTVFKLKVKNYTYPKVKVEPLKAIIIARNGRKYSPFSLDMLEKYYLPYAIAYSGNAYEQYNRRKDILKATLYRGDIIFSGQEEEGYLVFPILDNDVKEIAVWLREVILRFDVTGQPVETANIEFLFHRKTSSME